METFWGVSYFVWLIICIAIAVLYLFVVPKAAQDPHNGIRERWILKYMHSLVWMLLAFSCILANYKLSVGARMMSLSALVSYILFMFTMIKVKMKKRVLEKDK
jgi:hypothetical protein